MNETEIISQTYPGFVPDGKGGYHKPKIRSQGSVAEPQHNVGATPDEANEVEAPYPGKCIVRITRISPRLLDPDNLYGGIKYHVDALRYAGLLRQDDPKAIKLEVDQDTTANRGGVARTEIEITLVEPIIRH